MTSSPLPNHRPIKFECVTPILRVENLQASIRYYVEVLGFTLEWGGGDSGDMASITRDAHTIMLCERDQGSPGTWLWIGVDDVHPLFEAYRTKGATILQPPTRYPWGDEMKIEDLDGHVLRFGSDPSEQE